MYGQYLSSKIDSSSWPYFPSCIVDELLTYCWYTAHEGQSSVNLCYSLSASCSPRATITSDTIVAATSRGRALINVIVDALSSDDVAVAIRPDTVATVLALLQGVFGAAFTASVFTSTFIQGEEGSFFDFGNGLHTGLNVDTSNRRWDQRSNKSCEDDEAHIGSFVMSLELCNNDSGWGRTVVGCWCR